jgi:hypothetical protein
MFITLRSQLRVFCAVFIIAAACRQPGPCSYDSSSAWAFLQKHVPSALLAAAATQALSKAATYATNHSSSSRQMHNADDAVSHEAAAAESAREWYDLGRALQHVRPRVPAWGFAPLPTVAAGFRQRGVCGIAKGLASGGGGQAAGLELLYDVQVTLVKRRTPGALNEWAEIREACELYCPSSMRAAT